MTLLLLAIGAGMAGIGAVAYGVLTAVGVFFAKQVSELKSSVSPQRAFELFRQHAWAGTVVLCGFVLGFLW
jgi:4-hydroxybenzoate polyprenyltransferase